MAPLFRSAIDLKWISSYLGATGIDIDASGNVYTTGYFFSNGADFDPGSGTFTMTAQNAGSNDDAFVLKLDANGNFVWAKQITGPYLERTSAIDVDIAGNIFLSGEMAMGPVDFDPGPGTYTLNASLTWPYPNDIYILKLSSTGNFLWVKQFGQNIDNDGGVDIECDQLGNVYMAGYFHDTIDFDPGPGITQLIAKQVDGFLLKLTTAGNFVWARRTGGLPGTQQSTGCMEKIRALYVDSMGYAYMTGMSNCMNVEFGTFTINPGGGFVTKLNPAGNFLWAKGLAGYVEPYCINVDKNGYVYSGGLFQYTADFDPGPATFTLMADGVIVSDIYLNKLDQSGNFVYAKQFGGNDDDACFGVTVDKKLNAYITGYYQSAAEFDPGPGTFSLMPIGGPNEQAYICKLSLCENPLLTAVPEITNCAGSALNMTATGNGTVTWYNSPTIQQPVFTGTIYAPALSSGTYTYYAVLTNSCSESSTATPVNVTVSPVPVLTASQLPSRRICAGEQATLTAGGAADYEWSKTGGVIGTGAQLIIQPQASTNYSVTGSNSFGCFAVASISVGVDACTSISEFNNTTRLTVYPVPSGKRITVEKSNGKGSELEIRDLSGRLVVHSVLPEDKTEVSLEDLKAGVYILELRSFGQIETIRLIKQ